jgi:hypothetical protein
MWLFRISGFIFYRWNNVGEAVGEGDVEGVCVEFGLFVGEGDGAGEIGGDGDVVGGGVVVCVEEYGRVNASGNPIKSPKARPIINITASFICLHRNSNFKRLLLALSEEHFVLPKEWLVLLKEQGWRVVLLCDFLSIPPLFIVGLLVLYVGFVCVL